MNEKQKRIWNLVLKALIAVLTALAGTLTGCTLAA